MHRPVLPDRPDSPACWWPAWPARRPREDKAVTGIKKLVAQSTMIPPTDQRAPAAPGHPCGGPSLLPSLPSLAPLPRSKGVPGGPATLARVSPAGTVEGAALWWRPLASQRLCVMPSGDLLTACLRLVDTGPLGGPRSRSDKKQKKGERKGIVAD